MRELILINASHLRSSKLITHRKLFNRKIFRNLVYTLVSHLAILRNKGSGSFGNTAPSKKRPGAEN